MAYGDFQSDTGLSLPTPGIDPESYTDPNKQRQRLLGAMLTAQARNMAQEQAAPAPASIDRGNDTLSAMVKTDPSSSNPNTDAVSSAFKDPNYGMGPNVTLAHAVLADQPATQYVDKAQGDLSQYQHNVHGLRGAIAPALLAATSILGAHSYNGGHLQDTVNTDMNDLMNRRQTKEQSLVNQVQNARQLQQQEYEADQRNRQQDIIAAGNNQTKTLMAHIMAGSRENVAGTQAEAKRYTADQTLTGREYAADSSLEGRKYAADQGYQGRIESARINADAALNRFLAGQDREDARQQRGFAHTDLKPTSDEDRRADLAKAAIGYISGLREIAQNRPDLWGKFAGRATRLRQLVGSDDEDVNKLKYLREQVGITQMGAHSMRSAQAIAPIADSVVGSFNSSPEAAIAVYDDAIQQLGTFTGIQQRPGVQGGVVLPAPGAGTGAGAGAAPPVPLTQQVTRQGQGASIAGGTIAPIRPGSRPEINITGRTAASGATAQPGDAFRGHIFLGGDWKNPNNWAKIGGK
jgi:hypothetical protein